MSRWDLQPKCTAPAAAEQVSEFYASEAWPSLEPSLGNSGTYGELRPHGVRQLLDFMASFAPLTSEDIFADLGSGRGGVLVQVVLDTPMRAIGVELSEKRANTAKRVADRLERSDRQRLTTLHGDFLKVDAWLNATLVYVNSAAFSVPLLFKLRSALQRLQPGSLALTVRRLPGCTRGLWPVGTISLPFNWARDVKMHAYMVAPWSQHGNHTKLAWLSAHARSEQILDCHSPSRQALRRLCGTASSVLQTWAASWSEGPGDPEEEYVQSATRRAWREFHAQHELERRGAEVDAQPGFAFAESLTQLDLEDHKGRTLLHHAAEGHAAKALQALLKARSFDFKKSPQLLQARDAAGQTVLAYARDNESVALLLEARAEVTDKAGCCPGALLAASMLCLDKNFLRNLPGDVGGLDALAIHHAAHCGAPALEALLARGFVVDHRDPQGRSPLHLAVDGLGVRVLLEAKAMVDEVDSDGSTVLHLAVTRRSGAPVVEALLNARASVEIRNKEGLLPADIALPDALCIAPSPWFGDATTCTFVPHSYDSYRYR